MTDQTKRRPKSTGSITVRKTGVTAAAPEGTGVAFEARVSLTGADGKRRQVSKTFRDQPGATGRQRKANADAKRWLREQLSAMDSGTFSQDHRMTVDQWVTRWLTAKGSSLRPATFISYRDLLNHHVVPRVGNIRLVDLKPSHLLSAYADVVESSRLPGRRPVGPATVQRANAVLRAALTDAMRDGYVARNVAALVRLPKVPKPSRNWWELDQVRTFQEFTRGDRHEALWLLVLRAGLRRGEALGLRWSDLELSPANGAPARAWVRQQVLMVGGKVMRGLPKSDDGVRDFVLDATTVKALKAWQKQQAAEQLAAGTSWGGDPEVFTNTVGRVTDPAAISKRFRALAKAAGLPVIRLHDGRHTSGSQMIASGVPLAEVSKLLGHSSVTITSDVYGHMLQDRKEVAALAMAARYGD